VALNLVFLKCLLWFIAQHFLDAEFISVTRSFVANIIYCMPTSLYVLVIQLYAQLALFIWMVFMCKLWLLVQECLVC